MMTIAIYTPFWDAHGAAMQMAMSVVSQTDRDWRWYVSIDAEAPDRHGADHLRTLAADDPRIVLVEERFTTRKIGRAKARAFDLVGEEPWAIELDCGDWLEDWAVALVNEHDHPGIPGITQRAAAMTTYFWEHWPNGRSIMRAPAIRRATAEGIASQVWSLMHMQVYRPECVREVGGYDDGLLCAEDWDLDIRLARRFGEFHVIKRAPYHKVVVPGREDWPACVRCIETIRHKLGLPTGGPTTKETIR